MGVYAANEEGESKTIKDAVLRILRNYNNVKQMHGFYVDEDNREISFDLVFDFKEENVLGRIREIKKSVIGEYPGYKVYIIADTDLE